MRIHQLQRQSQRKNRKRVGRGNGSGHGTYSCRGMKGQKSRSGGGVRPGFEGGQLPKVKSLPTLRGFTNIFKQQYCLVNVSQLVTFPVGTTVTPEALASRRIIRNTRLPVKILGNGALDHSLTVEAHRFSWAARQKIEAAGGVVKEL